MAPASTPARLLTVALLVAAAGPAWAQGTQRPLLPNIPIPAEPNRPDPSAQVVRRLVLTQLDAEGETIGTPLELTCPATGCQASLTLAVEGRSEQFTVAATFVARGTYVNLEARSLGSARVVEYGAGRIAPAFIPTRGREQVSRELRYVVSRDRSAREANRESGLPADPNVLSDGNVFTRKQEWDLTLRAEVRVLPR